MHTLADFRFDQIEALLKRIELKIKLVASQESIPGSFWGEPEAGLIQNTLFARKDTPLHSVLHEASHYVCMTPQRRKILHTNALGKSKGDFVEENAVCYLQILLANEIPEFGREKIFSDMDDWGYSFRLGSTREWFAKDSEDARQWLLRHKLINQNSEFQFSLRQ